MSLVHEAESLPDQTKLSMPEGLCSGGTQGPVTCLLQNLLIVIHLCLHAATLTIIHVPKRSQAKASDS